MAVLAGLLHAVNQLLSLVPAIHLIARNVKTEIAAKKKKKKAEDRTNGSHCEMPKIVDVCCVVDTAGASFSKNCSYCTAKVRDCLPHHHS